MLMELHTRIDCDGNMALVSAQLEEPRAPRVAAKMLRGHPMIRRARRAFAATGGGHWPNAGHPAKAE